MVISNHIEIDIFWISLCNYTQLIIIFTVDTKIKLEIWSKNPLHILWIPTDLPTFSMNINLIILNNIYDINKLSTLL